MTKRKLGAKPYLMPQPPVLVGTRVDGKVNFMLASWCGMANAEPPMLGVAVRPSRHTRAGIEQNRQFSINIARVDQAMVADYCGIHSGRKRDKSGLFKVFYGDLADAPLIEECPVNLECRLANSLEFPTHILFVAEITEVHADESCFDDQTLDLGLIDPLVYSMSDGHYWGLGRKVGRAFSMGKDFSA